MQSIKNNTGVFGWLNEYIFYHFECKKNRQLQFKIYNQELLNSTKLIRLFKASLFFANPSTIYSIERCTVYDLISSLLMTHVETIEVILPLLLRNRISKELHTHIRQSPTPRNITATRTWENISYQRL